MSPTNSSTIPTPDAPPRRSLRGLPDQDAFWGTAAELRERVARREVRAIEVVERALARSAAVQPKINCFAALYADDARAAAERLDRQLARRDFEPPLLCGVPFALKDLTPLNGRVTTMGSRAFADHVTDYDPVIYRRLVAAGAILLGKTTLSELCSAALTETELFGITRNPWNLDRTSGGSSGGAGAAVAAGCLPLAEGTDIGGSIRSPAIYNGVVGLKPAVGRIPMDIMPTLYDTMMHFGPLAASVHDAALFLDATSGPDDADPLSLPASGVRYRDAPADVAGLSIGLNYDYGYYRMSPDVIRALDRAADHLRASGARVEPVEIRWNREIDEAWYRGWSVYLAACLGEEIDARAALVGDVVRAQVAMGRSVDAVAYKKIELLRSAMWKQLVPLFRQHDALLCPATSRTAPPVGMKDDDFFAEDEHGRLIGMSMHLHFNFVPQCPSLSIPAGFAADGLPIGVQIVGRRFDEFTAFRVGKTLEAAEFAGTRRPPL